MITTKILLEKAYQKFEYAPAETVCISDYEDIHKPGLEKLAEKVGMHEFDPSYLVILQDVDLCGPALVGMKDGDVILDTAYYGRLDVLERNYPYFQMAIESLNAPAEEITFATSFTGAWGGNYFHWTLDYLPRIQALKAFNITPSIFVDWNVLPFHSQSMDYYSINKIIPAKYCHYKVKWLVVITNRRSNGIVYNSAIDYMRRPHSYITRGHERIYITRRHADKRRVINEDELIKELAKFKIKTYVLEHMTWKEQVDLFKNAELVISPHGAGLANLIYSDHPGVIELQVPSYVNPCVFTLCASQNWDYHPVLCEQHGFEDMIICTDEVIEKVERIVERLDQVIPEIEV